MGRQGFERLLHDKAVLRTPPHERPLSAKAMAFLPPERDPYDHYIEPDDAVRTACARARARTGGAA